MDEFYCEYAMPCGWCDKLNKQCPKINNQRNDLYEEQNQAYQDYCDHNFELINEQTYYPSVRKTLRCTKCGFEKIRYINM